MIFTPGEMADLTLKKELLDSLSGSVIQIRMEDNAQNE